MSPGELLCTLPGHRWNQRPRLQIESVKGKDIKSFNNAFCVLQQSVLRKHVGQLQIKHLWAKINLFLKKKT